MSKILVNLTLPTILGEIEETLQTFPHHPYQQFFANPNIRQDLVAYVLTRIPSNYVAVEEVAQPSVEMTTQLPSGETKSRMERLVHQGIQEILNNANDTLDHTIPSGEDAGLAASHWFG